MLQEFTINSKRKEIVYGDPASLIHDVQNSFVPGGKIKGVTVMLPVNLSDTSLQHKLFLCTVYEFMETEYVIETKEPTRNSIDIIIKNIDYLMNQSVIHKKALKRFAKEHIIDSIDPIILNPKGTKNKNAFMFYIIYLIGKYLENINDIEQINQLIEKHLGKQNKEYTVNDDYSVKLKERILEDEDYSAVLSQGARLIMDWE